MYKAFFLFLLIFAIAQLGFCVYSQYSLSSLPWNDYQWKKENPYIVVYGSEEIYDSNNLQQSLASLDLSNSFYDSINYSTVKDNILSARGAYQNTLKQRDLCDNQITSKAAFYSIVISAFSNNVYPADFLFDYFTVFKLRNGIANSSSGAQFITILFRDKDCTSYADNWKLVMNSATGSILTSQEINNQLGKSINFSLDKLYFSGVCENDYAGPERTACDDIELNLKDYNKVNSNIEKSLMLFNTNISKNQPDTSTYFSIMSFFWSKEKTVFSLPSISIPGQGNFFSQAVRIGAVPLGSGIINESDSTIYSALSNLATKKSELQKKSDEVDNQTKFLSTQNLDLIKESNDFNGIIGSDTSTIAQRFSSLSKKQQSARDLVDNASIPPSKKDYLKDSLNNINSAKKLVISNQQESVLILQDTQTLVDNKKQITTKEFADLKSIYDSKNPSSDIKNEFEKIQSIVVDNNKIKSETYGMQFQDYSSVLLKISSLKSKIQGYNPATEKQADFQFEELKKLLENAKKDKLDTASADLQLSLIEDSKSKTQYLQNMKDIKSGLINRATTLYSNLQSQSEALHFQVDDVPELSSFKVDLLKYEQDLFKDGYLLIDDTTIGKLSGLKKNYADLELELSKYKSLTMASKLVPSTTFYVNGLVIDQAVPYSFAVNINNPYGIEAENVKIFVPTDLNLMFTKSDIRSGRENVLDVTYNKNNLELTLKNVSKYSIYQVVFDKTAVLARSDSSKKFVYADGSGEATIDLNYTILMDINASLVLNKSSIYYVDGSEYSGGVLSAGSHTLSSESKMFNAYQTSYENYQTNRLGLNQIISYDQVISSDIDIDRVPIFISDKNNGKISRLSVIAVTGHKILTTGMLGNGAYKTEIYEIKKFTNATLRINYVIENVTDYINEKIAILQTSTNNSQILSLVNAAQKDLQNNDTSKAVIDVEKAQNELDKISLITIQKQAEYNSLKEIVDKKYSDINLAISKLDQNSEFYPLMLKRKNDISSVLSLSEELKQNQIDKAISGLKQFDDSWEKTTIDSAGKKIFLDYNALKSSLLSHGFQTSSINEFYLLENSLKDFENSNDINSFVSLANAFAKVSLISSDYELNYSKSLDEVSGNLSILKNQLKAELASYILEYKNAKGSNYEQMFPFDPAYIDKLIKDSENIISKKGSLIELYNNNQELQSDTSKIKSTLAELRTSSENQVSALKTLFAAKKDSIDSAKAAKIQKNIDSASSFIANKQYVDALKLSQNTLLDLNNTNPKDQFQLILISALTVIILGGIAFYIMKQKKGEEGKVFKKLENVENESIAKSSPILQNSGEK